MKRLLLAAFLLPIGLQASIDFQFDPAGPQKTGAAGTTVGWGIRVTPDPIDWVSVTFTTIVSETNPIGTYTDLLGPFGGPIDFLFAPGGPQYTAPFDLVAGTGLGSYAIDPSTPPGAVDQLTVRIGYDVFDGDPLTCTSCSYLGSDTQDLAASVMTPTPEPAFSMALAAGLGLIGLARWRAKRCNA